jgi:hypothetical protein
MGIPIRCFDFVFVQRQEATKGPVARVPIRGLARCASVGPTTNAGKTDVLLNVL